MISFNNHCKQILESSKIEELSFNIIFTLEYRDVTRISLDTIFINTKEVLNYIYKHNKTFDKFGEYAKASQTTHQGFYIKDPDYGFIRSPINYIDTGINLNRALNGPKLNDDFKKFAIKDPKLSKFLDIFSIEDEEEPKKKVNTKITVEDVLRSAANFFHDTMNKVKSWDSIVNSNLDKERDSTDAIMTFFEDNEFKILKSTQMDDFNNGIDFKVERNGLTKTVQVKNSKQFREYQANTWKDLYKRKGVDYLTIYTEYPPAIHFINLNNNKYKLYSLNK